MIINNSFSPLPFYDTAESGGQDAEKPWAHGETWPLIADLDTLLPFQFVTDTSMTQGMLQNAVIKVEYGKRLEEQIDISDSLRANGMRVREANGYMTLTYPGRKMVEPKSGLKLTEGKARITISGWLSPGERYKLTSETVHLVRDTGKYLQLDYGNSADMQLRRGLIDFSDNFRFRVFLDTMVGRPNYTFTEEATERMGHTFVESQVSKKEYGFTFIAPEYLCDAMRIVAMCDDRLLKSRGRTYDITHFTMNPSWEEQGNLASVKCGFETDTIVSSVGGYVGESYWGHYNNDYNNDYNNGE